MIGSGGKKEGWPECFQDLGGWCPLPQDELHTPKVNLQDEFNFSIDDGHANWELSFPEDLQNDLWGNDTQYGISPSQPLLGELNSTTLQERTPLGVISEKTPNLLGSGGKLFTIKTEENRSPLKTKGNVLLSQGIVKSASDDSTLFNMAATFEQKTNNNNSDISSNPVIITNNCYLLPITVPEIASAKLNSSSLSTSFITSQQQQEQQATPASVQDTKMDHQQQQHHTKKISLVGRENVNSSNINITSLHGGNAASLLQQSKLENVRIKDEEKSLEDGFKVPAISCNNNTISLGETATTTSTPTASLRRDKPQLKLNIAAAANIPKFTSSTFNTPEVLGPLVDSDSKEFNLLQYVCNDGEFPGLSSQEVDDDDKSLEERTMVRDHDYTDSWPSSDVKSDIVIKSEPGSPTSTSCSISNRSSTSKDAQQRARKKRQRGDSSDYNISSTTDDTSDYSENDSQQEWVPTPTKKRKKRKTSSANYMKANVKSGIRKAVTAGGGGASVRTSAHSTNGGTVEVQDKYRALRERNNEASRRSRMNRKQRDVEMLVMAEELHKKNVYLKARAEKMEGLVKYMRAEIMKALTKPK